MKQTLVRLCSSAAAVALLLPIVLLAFPVPACIAQVPSIEDTLRVVGTSASLGDSFFVDVEFTNVDTVGAYALRVVYDPNVIEPLTDTFVVGLDTTIYVELELLRGTAFEDYGASVPSPGVLNFAALDLDGDTSEVFLPGTGVAVRFHWRALGSATPQVTPIEFKNDPVFPSSWNTLTDYWGIIFKRPVLTAGTVTLVERCECPFQGDMDANGLFDPIDLNAIIDVLFFGGFDIRDAHCPSSRVDWNGDGQPDPLDLNAAIDHLFFLPNPPGNPCP